MHENWDILLARYQKRRGGLFFGPSVDSWADCDSQLILTEGEKTPLLASVHRDNSGRAVWTTLVARTTVMLNAEYKLHIRAKSLTGSGFQTVMRLAGDCRDYGDPRALAGRVVTSSSRAFTKLMLGDLALRNALAAREGEYLRVGPSLLENGAHVVEVGIKSINGSLTDPVSPWVTSAISEADAAYFRMPGREPLLEQADRDFAEQMDGFLDFLRAARDAVTRWPVPTE